MNKQQSNDRQREEENIRRMATVVRDSNDAITIQDLEGKITAWNHGAEVMYGYGEAEALEMNIARLTAPGKIEEQVDFTRRLLAGEAVTSFETQRVTQDGRILDVWMTVTKLVDDAGKVIGVASTERDITERKRKAEEASRMVTVVRDSNDAITIQDLAGKITAWNHGAELMFGYSEPEALKMTIWQLAPPSKAAEQKDFNRRLFSGEAVTSFETQRMTRDGRILDVWLTVTKLVDDAGKVIGIASTERDITERKQEAEEASRMVTVVRDSNDAITIQDPEGKITAWNHGAELMYGYGEAEALEMNIRRLTAPGKVEEQEDFTRRLLAGEAVTSLETQRVTRDGCILDVWMTVTKLVDDAGEVIGVASTERDITEQKRVEEARRKAIENLERSNKELEQFAYVASHDLQEPLRMVASYTQLLAERYKGQLDPDAQDFIGYAVDGAKRMQRLIQDLLSFSRVTTRGRKPEPVDARAALGEAIGNLQAAIEESGAVVTHDELPAVLADRGQLVQVFQNLVGNAIKFRLPNKLPRVHVSVERGTRDAECGRTGGTTDHADGTDLARSEGLTMAVSRESATLNRSFWTFSIRDNGIGIVPKYFGRLFVIFQRLQNREDYPGTGIGLAICKRIIERLDGKIWVESKPGEGATFRFTLTEATLQIEKGIES